MRKLSLLAALLLPSIAFAQAATGAGMQIEALADTVLGFAPYMLMVLVLAIGARTAFGEGSEVLVMGGVAAIAIVGGLLYGLHQLGVFGWIAAHWMVSAAVVVAVAVVGVAIASRMEKAERSNQVRDAVGKLLATIGQVDELLQHWNAVVDAGADGLTGDAKREFERAQDIQSSLAAINNKLIPMLDQVHGGVPMSSDQNTAYGKICQELRFRATYFSPPDMVPVGEQLATVGARSGRLAPPAPAVETAPSSTASKATVPAPASSLTDDLFNPLLVLSLFGAAHACGAAEPVHDSLGTNTFIEANQGGSAGDSQPDPCSGAGGADFTGE